MNASIALAILACATLVAGAPNTQRATCPTIITRSQWGARAPTSTTWLGAEAQPWVVIHHAESGACTTQSSCSQMVRNFQAQHMDSNGWADIGYNFLIGGDGNAYEGRGWDKVGAHAPGYNSQSLGMCMIGSFTSSLPNAAALATVKQLIACAVTNGELQSSYGLIGHRQAISTDCPGNALYAHIQGWDHWQNV